MLLFQERKALKIFMINTIDEINKAAREDARGFIKLCGEEYKNRICEIATTIADDDDIKIVSIAGPSGSGKTTTAHILCQKLQQLEETVEVVSLDDFYLENHELPRLPDGSFDIESVNSLDIQRIKKCFDDIITSGKTVLPYFDFKNKVRNDSHRQIDIGDRGIIIVEGLHAMNPLITGLVPRKNIYKVYISVNVPVENENGQQILSTRQIRLARRVLRDEQFRNSTAEETLRLWNNVIDGESKYLYCFKNTADVCLTTLHPYELGVYKKRFCSLRNTVSKNTPCREFFLDTVNAFEQFVEIDSSLVPKDSLIREFIG